jgi:predicted N-acetyltransferase YhbS
MTAILPADRNRGVTTIRALTEADVDAAADVQLASFDDLDRRQGGEVERRTEIRVKGIRTRIRHFLRHDAAGSWVATDDGGTVVGVALASVRGDLWGLSLLVVTPGVQSAGAGRRLLDAALSYSEGCDRAVILSSRDPRAIRLYATSGFDLHPQMAAEGIPDLRELPASVTRCRAIGPDDDALLEKIDQQVRRATRGPDHEWLGRLGLGYVCDDDAGQGYAYCTSTGSDVFTLAAGDDATASDLLWRCLQVAAVAGGSIKVSDLGAGQQWGMRTALAARLSLAPRGPVFWRGGSPPPAYLPSGSLL